MPRFRPRITVRWLMVAVAVVALSLALIAPICQVLDARVHGPYSTWYNSRCQALCDRGGLIGRPESDVVSILGVPSSVWEYDQPGGRTKTFNYSPSMLPTAMFQVHCRGGVVVGLEQFDD